MAVFCYTWDNADVYWNTVQLTWAEFCIITEITKGGATKSQFIQRIRKLHKDEKQIIVGLFARIFEEDKEFQTRVNKHKNTKVKVRIKDIEMFLKEAKNIDVRIFIDKKDNEL